MSKPTPGCSTEGRNPVDELATELLTASRVVVAVSADSLAVVGTTVTSGFRTLVVLQTSGPIHQKCLAEQPSITFPQR